MSETTSETMRESADGGLSGDRPRGVLRAIVKSPPQELRRLVVAAASALPAGRDWWAKRRATPGGTVRA